jgi:hypothetical protein
MAINIQKFHKWAVSCGKKLQQVSKFTGKQSTYFQIDSEETTVENHLNGIYLKKPPLIGLMKKININQTKQQELWT